MLDYIVAFAVIGFGGSFRKRFGSNQAMQLVCGSLLICLLRYACHVISGATVWAGLSIPTKAALAYSFAYNATYMVPETIVLVAVAYFLGNSLDFRLPTPVRVNSKHNRVPVYTIIGLFIAAAVIIADVVLIFSKLQDAETGNWNSGGFAEVNWILVAIISGVGAIAVAAMLITDKEIAKNKNSLD